MIKLTGLSLIFLTIAFISVSGQTANVPDGSYAMVDGRCSTNEWQTAGRTAVSDKYSVRFMKTRQYVYICIESAVESNFTMDLYFSPDSADMYTFHSSAKLGERKLSSDKWIEFTTDWDWWNVNGWTANTRNFNSCERTRFLPNKAIEYQIDRKQFGGKNWRVAFDFLGPDQPLIYPANADKLKRDTWLMLRL